MSETGAPGALYIVATPIGNLEDLTPRAARTFAEVDFIAAEDTRVTVKLLNYLGLKKPLLSYHKYSDAARGSAILARVCAGESCALCSDAGMPAVSDPGEELVREAIAQGIRVVPVPAASAAVTALAVSGQFTGRWAFEGFLPTNRRQRAARLEEICADQRTLIFYEAPHKLVTTLGDLLEAFGDRSVSVCRELTKLHEEIRKTTLAAALADYREGGALAPPRGEFVLVVAGAQPPAPEAWTLDAAVALAAGYAAAGQAQSAACRAAAAESGFSKSEIYRALTAQKEGDR